MTGRLPFAVAGLLVGAASLAGQAADGGVSLEVGAARTFPPSGTDAAQASYGMAGVRAERWAADGTGAWGRVHGATALDRDASHWASADVGGQAWAGLGGGLDLGMGVAAYGFTVGAPYSHRALTGELTPGARLRLGQALVVLGGVAGWGRSVVEVRHTDTTRLERHRLDRAVTDSSDAPLLRRAEHDLWYRGLEPEVRVIVGPAVAGLSAGVFDSPRGTYRKASVSLAGFFGLESRGAWTVAASAWDTPHGRELTGGVSVSVPLGDGWSARATGTRSDPSPLILTGATNHGGVTLSKRLWSGGLAWDPSDAVATVDASGRVDFTVRVTGAERVEVLGDFTDWEPVALRREGGLWVTTLTVPPGLYHFGFLVDGEWFLPDEGVGGRVSDEWGRENGILVVPEET